MPATETKHTPEHWAQNFAAYISELDAEEYVAELADLKRRADQADRLRDLLSTMTALCRLKYGNLDAGVYQEIQAAEAALAANPPAR